MFVRRITTITVRLTPVYPNTYQPTELGSLSSIISSQKQVVVYLNLYCRHMLLVCLQLIDDIVLLCDKKNPISLREL